MSLASMLASADRLSKNLERKISKPIIKNESKVNVNDKQIKKEPKIVHAATVPRRSVFEVTKTRLLVPLTPEPAQLNHPRVHENTVTVSYMPSKKDVAVQTVPFPLFQQQPVEMGSTDNHPTQQFSRKTLNSDAPFKEIVKKFDKFLRKNMKTTMLFKKYIDNLSARRFVAAASNHDYRKYLMYFSSFSIGVITTYLLNCGYYYLQRIENPQHLLQ
ncbi:uncharacterized protein LOC111030213 isoform X2 [Myzus persicae]|nr:uncharacterized protein LOC111030213 isoform X2 [Myzus persicae]